MPVVFQSWYIISGIEYNIGRIPIASCDFSNGSYSYADMPGDFHMNYFKLAKEDLNYKVCIGATKLKFSE